MPTVSGPVGAGTAAEVVTARSARTAAASALLIWWALPDKATCCGLSELLSLMDKDAFEVPVAVGLKVTVIVQDAPAATLEAQSFVWAKTGVPPVVVIEMLSIESAEVPVFVSVVAWGWMLVVHPGGEGRNLQLKARRAGTSFTVPPVRVMVAFEDLVASVAEIALRVTVAFAGSVAGAV